MIITVLQIVVSVALITLIALQERSGGMSGLFGGGESGGVYQTRRGLEKIFFTSTIILAIVFVGLAIFQFLN